MKTINTRRSIRVYQNRDVDNDLLNRLLSEATHTDHGEFAALFSGNNTQ